MAKKNGIFEFCFNVSSPKRTSVRLGEGVNLPLTIAATPRCREGPPKYGGLPRRGQLRLGEPRNMECGLSGPPKRRWATPRCACDFLRPVFVACIGSISWPGLHVIMACFVGHCVTFECVITWLRVTWSDVNLSLSWNKRGIRAKKAHFLVLII